MDDHLNAQRVTFNAQWGGTPTERRGYKGEGKAARWATAPYQRQNLRLREAQLQPAPNPRSASAATATIADGHDGAWPSNELDWTSDSDNGMMRG